MCEWLRDQEKQQSSNTNENKSRKKLQNGRKTDEKREREASES